MPKFIEKLTPFYAIQWNGDNWDELDKRFNTKVNKRGDCPLQRTDKSTIIVRTEGEYNEVPIGHWIVESDVSICFSCSNERFIATYNEIAGLDLAKANVLENISSNLERIADAIEDFNHNSFYKRPGKD